MSDAKKKLDWNDALRIAGGDGLRVLIDNASDPGLPEVEPLMAHSRPPEHRVAEDGAVLLTDVYNFLGRFVAYPSPHAQVAHALWVAHTHLMEAWETTPRLAFLSPEPQSGKTRALEITALLVPRPVTSFNASPAY